MKKNPQYQKKKKAPKKITERYLRNVAKYYLERHITSSDQFRRVLQKRVYKSVKHHHTNTPENTDATVDNPSKKQIAAVDYHTALELALALVEKEVQYRIEKGELNDLEFSRNKVRVLHKQGNSKMQIKTKLHQKGISSEIIDTVISELYTPSRFLETQLEANIPRANTTHNSQVLETQISNISNPEPSKYDREIIRLQMEREIREISNASFAHSDKELSPHQAEPTEHQIHRHIEIQAAIAYAKKRGFGPFRRDEEKRNIKREKDIQSMVRAGHMYHNSKFVIDAKDIDALFCIDLHSL